MPILKQIKESVGKKSGTRGSTLEQIRNSVKNSQGRELFPVSTKAKPAPKQSTLGKVGGAIKDIAKSVASSAITIPARPFQAVAMASGASEEDINRISSKVSGGLIAPVPTSGKDVMKDVGRVVETGSFFIPGGSLAKLAVGGAVGGVGASLTQGNDLLSKETLGYGVLGAGLGAGLHVGGKMVGPTLRKVIGKGKVPTEIETKAGISAGESVTTKADDVPTSVEKPTPKKGEVTIPPPEAKPTIGVKQAMVSLEEQGYSKGQISAIMGKVQGKTQASKFTPKELYTVAQEMIPDNAPTVVSNAVIKARPPRTGAPVVGSVDNIVDNTVDNTPLVDNQPVTVNDIPEQKSAPVQPTQPVDDIYVNKIVDMMEKESPADVPFERQVNADQVRIALNEGIDKIEQVVLNFKEGMKVAKGSNIGAYLAVLKEEATKRAIAGDASLSKKILNSQNVRNIGSKTGQILQSFQIAAKDNPLTLIMQARSQLEGKLPKAVRDRKAKEIAGFKEKINKIFKEMSGKPLSKKETSEIVESIIC